MSGARRYAFLGVALALLLALALGAFSQLTTSRALERAESLRFRRMLVTRHGDKGYRFFFATNRRERERGGASLEQRFSNERDTHLRFGSFDTYIEPSLGIGMLVNPTDWFQNEEINLRKVRELDPAQFVFELREQIQASPYRAVLINVNGFRERFPTALRKTAFLAHVLDIDVPLLVFDWPGDQGSTPRGYLRAQRVARESGAELAATLVLVLDELGADRVWLLANSMGAEVVVGAFSLLAASPRFADLQTEIEEVVLTAPDVSHQEFGAQFKDEINALVENLTIYVSSNDRALLMSRVLNRSRRLGESTVDPANPDQSEEAARAFELVEADSDRVTLVDVTPVNRTRNFHNFSLETPEFFDDLYMRLTNEEAPRTRLQYPVRTASGARYWVLTRGR